MAACWADYHTDMHAVKDLEQQCNMQNRRDTLGPEPEPRLSFCPVYWMICRVPASLRSQV